MKNDNSKKRYYETVHDEYFSYAKFLSAFAFLVCIFYTIKGLFIGETLVKGITKSWIDGYCVPILLIVLIVDLRFFLDWLVYLCVKKIVICKGTMHNGTIVSEVEVRHAHKGAIRLEWKYVIEIEDCSTYLSTAYTNRIPVTQKCTVYVLGSKCIITDFEK